MDDQDQAHPRYCVSHNVIEPLPAWLAESEDPSPYAVCPECNHLYATERDLQEAWERWENDDADAHDWDPPEPPPGHEILACQECSHDF